MSEVKRWVYRCGLMITPLPRDHKYREESVYPDEVPEWVSGTDYDKLQARIAELEAKIARLGRAVLNAVGYEAQLHEHHALHEFNAFIAALEDTHE